MGKFILITIVFGFVSLIHSASIDCESNQCKKISLLYQAVGCKAIKTSKSCCPKRFECPDFKKSDDDENIFNIRRGCLPVFHPDKDTPVDWKCPTDDQEEAVKKVVKRSSPSGNLAPTLWAFRGIENEEETTTQRIFDIMEAESTTTTIKQTTFAAEVETSSVDGPLPTLSLNPFIGPKDDSSTIPVFVKYDDELSTTTPNPVTTQIDPDFTTRSKPSTSATTYEFQTTTYPPIDSDLITSTMPDKMFEEKISTTTEFAKVATEANNEITEKLITTTESSTNLINTTLLPQPRELDFLNIPRSLSGSPIKPAIISTSPETVRASPSEISSILASLRELVARVESLAMPSMTDEVKSKSNNQNNRKRRSIIEKVEEIKQKTLNRGCVFEGTVFKVGERISNIVDQCLECTCEYAPIAHCVVNHECPL